MNNRLTINPLLALLFMSEDSPQQGNQPARSAEKQKHLGKKPWSTQKPIGLAGAALSHRPVGLNGHVLV